MQTKNIFILSAVALFAVIGSTWYLSQPHSFEDCVLKNVKDSQNVTAAALIQNACRAKFPSTFTFEEALAKKK